MQFTTWKFNTDAKNDGLENVSPFKNLGGVDHNISAWR